jgi:hypothetical protein
VVQWNYPESMFLYFYSLKVYNLNDKGL